MSFLLIAPRNKTEALLPLRLWQRQSQKSRAAHSPVHNLRLRSEALQKLLSEGRAGAATGVEGGVWAVSALMLTELWVILRIFLEPLWLPNFKL